MNTNRKPISDDELAARLTEGPRVEPPADLLERLLADLPVAPAVLPTPANEPRIAPPHRWTRWTALAASLSLVVGGGLVALRVIEQSRALAPVVATEDAVGAPRVDQTEPSQAKKIEGDLTDPPAAPPAAPSEPKPSQPHAAPVALAAPAAPATPEVRARIERQAAEVVAPAEEALAFAEALRVKPDPALPRRVSGIARDAESGQPLPGVTITAASPNLLGVRAVLSDSSGAFTLPPIPAGPYDITAELDGYQTLLAKVDLNTKESAELEIAMPPGMVSEELIVTTTPAVSIAATSTSSQTIAYERDLPTARTLGRARKVEGTEAAPAPRTAVRILPPGSAPSAPPPSATTGGTAEPNDQPYGHVFVRPSGINPFITTEDDPLSTFALEVDTGSWSAARAWLERGELPPSELIRVEEALNSYDYGDARPKRADFALAVQGAPSPWPGGARRQLVRIGLSARELERGERRPVTLVVLIDTSGSMAQGGRLELVKGALGILLERLRPGDRVGLVTYSSHAEVVLEPSSDLQSVRRAIDRLHPQSSTNAEAGLLTAYGLAERSVGGGRDVRVLWASDGVANVGATGPDSLHARLGRWHGMGIELTAVGVGLGNYNDVLLEQLANRANGRYHYVDDLREAERIFGDSLDGTLSTLAHDARAQVAFDPRQVERWRLIGYENRAMPDSAFRDDRRDAGEIGFGHRVTALYELVLTPDTTRRMPLGEVRLRWRPRGERDFVEVAEPIRREDLAPSFERAAPALRLAAAVAGFAEVLRGSPWVAGLELREVRRWIDSLPRQQREREEVRRLGELVRTAERLGARAPEGDFEKSDPEPAGENDEAPTERRPPLERR